MLLLGETGVGKEVVSELIHQLSPRADKALIRLNCAALPDQLLESELFGYERGAFTGADRPKKGLLEAGDLYRSVESYEKAGDCYQRYGEPAQAAEMFVQADDRERAALAYVDAMTRDMLDKLRRKRS